MSEMIERVAKAIRDTNANTIGLTFHELSRAMARAAIETMRDPTAPMSLAGTRAIQAWEENDPDGILMDFRELSCWRAMIDAALSQGTHSLPSEDR